MTPEDEEILEEGRKLRNNIIAALADDNISTFVEKSEQFNNLVTKTIKDRTSYLENKKIISGIEYDDSQTH